MRTQTFEVLRVPLDAVYTVGPGKTRPGPRNLLPVRIFLLLLCLGCRARRRRGGGGCRCLGCGGRRSIERAPGMRMYVTASSTRSGGGDF